MEVLAIVLGLIIGSFLSVCIFRIPLSRTDLWEEDAGEKDLEAGAETEGEPIPLEEGQAVASQIAEESPEVSTAGVEVPTSTEAPTSSGAVSLKTPGQVSLTYPARSFCPHCEKQLLWWHNIPVISWILLRGRCGFCSEKISARYPLVELLSAVTAYLSVHLYGLTLTAAIVYLFCCALIVISFIDYDFFIIPNSISMNGFYLGLGFAVINHFYHLASHPVAESLPESLLGVATGGGVLWAISEFYLRFRKMEGLGLGDVKLLAMTGAWFGWECSFYTIFVGSLLGSVIGIGAVVLRLRTMKQVLPFGPFLALGTVLYLFTGMELIEFLANSIVTPPGRG